MEVHHHPHIEKKSFKEYLLEGLMIFLAVTMGFIAENIREHFVTKKHEKEYMVSLVRDLNNDITGIAKSEAQVKDYMNDADSILSLFKNADYHISIIETLASRPQGLARHEIMATTAISEGVLSRTLEELLECNFISLYQPFSNKKKDTLYKLTYLYSLFYLKFIKPNKTGGKKTWEQLTKQ